MFRKVKLYWKKNAVKFYNTALFHYLLALVFVVGGLMTMAAIVLCNDIETNNATQMFGYEMYYRDDTEIFEGGMPSTSGIKDSVLVLEKCGWDDLDVAPGMLICVDDNMPESFASCCLTDTTVSEWYITVVECGGYHPISTGCWTLEVWQGKAGKIGEIDVSVNPTELPGCIPGCCCEAYIITFSLPDCTCIHLDSNHFPELINCDWIGGERTTLGRQEISR